MRLVMAALYRLGTGALDLELSFDKPPANGSIIWVTTTDQNPAL